MTERILKINEVKQNFILIPAGEFLMGSPNNEPQRMSNEFRHKVILTKNFWIADTACTQALWEAVMGKNPSSFKGALRPVETVSWNDCQKFIAKLNELEGTDKYRLPTEAEWEYACRAGTETPFSFGENITPEQVNYDGNSPYHNGEEGKFRKETVEVKSLPPNNWGLYEMHGNVWEWCQDWHDPNYYKNNSPIDDPKGPNKGVSRVLRGGSWDVSAGFARSAFRYRYDPGFRFSSIGFRLVGR